MFPYEAADATYPARREAASGNYYSGKRRQRGILARIKASLRSPLLVGKSGSWQRYLKVQWWVAFWRLLILVQIPEVAVVQPDRFSSVSYAFFMLGLGLAYTVFYYWMATRTRVAGKRVFHAIDLLVCAALILAAHDDKLIFIMSFYSYSSLLSRPTVLLRDMVPATVFLSLAYLAAYELIGLSPLAYFSHPNPDVLGSFALYYFWGLGFVGFSAVLERASSLELDTHLEEQRQSYRRRLHDDLGNTLCGLHFRIQSLGQVSQSDELKQALDFLVKGYDRANQVLKRLLNGFDEEGTGNLKDSLLKLKEDLRLDEQFQLDISLPDASISLSPEVEREVLSIVREAITNTIRHANASRLEIQLKKRFSRLVITIADRGRGFHQAELKAKQSQGSLGIKGMQERARLIKGQVDIESHQGMGTTVTLKVDMRRRSGIISHILNYNPERSLSGIYPFLIRLRTFMYLWTMIQLLIQPAGQGLRWPVIVVVALISLDIFAWIFLSSPFYRALSRRPWLLIWENALFIMTLYLCQRAAIPFFFPLYVGVAVIMNGLFLDALGNLALVSFLNAGIIATYATAPPGWVDILVGGRYESSLQHAIIYTILAFSSGLAGEFVKNLESLQLQAIARALARQRERLTAETHRQLYWLVGNLGKEIKNLSHLVPEQIKGFSQQNKETYTLSRRRLQSIESRSTDLKRRLRLILKSLEEPPSPATSTSKAEVI